MINLNQGFELIDIYDKPSLRVILCTSYTKGSRKG